MLKNVLFSHFNIITCTSQDFICYFWNKNKNNPKSVLGIRPEILEAVGKTKKQTSVSVNTFLNK